MGLEIFGPAAGSAAVEVRNVVGESTGTGSAYGLRIAASGDGFLTCGNFDATLKNSYGRGTSPTLDLNVSGAMGTVSCSGVVHSQNSLYRDRSTTMGGTVISSGDLHNVTPLFVNPVTGDYHQLPGSPTIDAGVADNLIGPFDIDGQARLQGPAPDIGIDEFAVSPSSTTATPDTVPPSGSSISFNPSSFVPESGKASVTRKKRKKGSTVTYKLSESATVIFTVTRRVNGRKKGKRCVVGRRHGRRCAFYKPVTGSFSRASVANANSFHSNGIVNGKKLKRGKYRMSGDPKDAAANRGRPFTGSFTVVRP